MYKYYNLLGLHIDEVRNFFEKENIKYTIKTIKGYKDTEKLIVPRVVKISYEDNCIEIIQTYFADSLI